MEVQPEALLIPTLNGRAYHDPASYARELDRIFERSWVCVGRAEHYPQPGSFRTVTLGRESVLVVRGRDGALRAFLNVCRHRGARLCPAESGQLRGSIQCRYHAWTYGLDGSLVGAPNLISAEAFDRSEHGLVPVALAEWMGLVWLNLSAAPGTVEEQVLPAIRERFGDEATFARYGMGNLRAAHTISYDVAANWKLCVENFMECYHCGPVHPELCRLIPSFRSGVSYQNHTGVGSAFAADVEAFTASGQGNRPSLPGLLPEDDRLYFGLVLWPNVLLSLLPDHIIVHTLLPDGPARSKIVCDWLFDPETIAQPGFDPHDAVEVFDLVNRQDWEMCELTQQGMASRAYARGGVYVPSEHHIARFNQRVLEHLGA
jgi:Rieske 2Fe-2S family protein